MRRAVDDSSRRFCLRKGQNTVRKLKRSDSETAFRNSRSGGDRRKDNRKGDGQSREKGRACKVLRRRYYEKEKTFGKAERGQKAYAFDRLGRSSVGSVYADFKDE